jgi:hypothetical protein
VNQDQFNERRLKERKQEPEESTIEFIYDMLDLCRKVDPNMSEAAKLSHMWRGLKPSLTEKLWSLKPASCDEFLREVRRYQEMTSRARQEDWAMGMLGKQMPPVKEDRLERLEKMMEGLMGAIVPKPAGQPPQQGWNPGNIQQRPGWNNRELQWTPDGQPICFGCRQVGHLNRDCPTTPRRRSRTEDGKIICFGCNEVGHTRPFCPKYQQQGRAPGQWQENTGNQLMGLVRSGGSQQEGTLPILQIDVKRMVTQEVLCGDKRYQP